MGDEKLNEFLKGVDSRVNGNRIEYFIGDIADEVMKERLGWMSNTKGLKRRVIRFLAGLVIFLGWGFVFLILPQILFGIGA